MRITIWGARGSIPVSGPEYLKYGGDAPCVEIVSADGRTIIVDAGTGIRRLGSQLAAGDPEAAPVDTTLLFTHCHWDHVMGFPFFAPIYEPGNRIRVLHHPVGQGDMQRILSRVMSPPYFPVPMGEIRSDLVFEEREGLRCEIGPVSVTSIPLSHTNRGYGLRFEEDGKSFVFLTDNELGHRHSGGRRPGDYAEFAADCDLLVHDAEYDHEQYATRRGWGHTLYTEALDLAVACGAGSFGLYHHNQDRTDEALDGLVAECRERIAASAHPGMDCFAAAQGQVIEL
jgi:phosphoribosyl 1,2-cyclic phosphodiesterase